MDIHENPEFKKSMEQLKSISKKMTKNMKKNMKKNMTENDIDIMCSFINNSEDVENVFKEYVKLVNIIESIIIEHKNKPLFFGKEKVNNVK